MSELIAALANPKNKSTNALQSAIEATKGNMIEFHQEWIELQIQAPQKPQKGKKLARKAELVRNASEGVVVAPATQSPRVAPTKKRLPLGPVPKELVIDMVDDFTTTEALGHGRRARKPHKFFKEVPAPQTKRKRPAAADDTVNPAAPQLKKRAMTRDVSVVDPAPRATSRPVSRAVSTSAPPPAPQPKSKRKRVEDEDGDVKTAPPRTKKRTKSPALSTAPPRTTRASSRAAYIASSAPPSQRTVAVSATAPLTRKRSRLHKDPSTAPVPAPTPKKAPAKAKAASGKGKAKAKPEKPKRTPALDKKGKGKVLDPVEEETEEVAAPTSKKEVPADFDELYNVSDPE